MSTTVVIPQPTNPEPSPPEAQTEVLTEALTEVIAEARQTGEQTAEIATLNSRMSSIEALQTDLQARMNQTEAENQRLAQAVLILEEEILVEPVEEEEQEEIEVTPIVEVKEPPKTSLLRKMLLGR